MGRCIEIVTDFGFEPDEPPSEEGREAWACRCNQDHDIHELCEVVLVWGGRVMITEWERFAIFGMRTLPRFPPDYDGYLEIHQCQFRSDHDDAEERAEAQVAAYQKLLLFVGQETLRTRVELEARSATTGAE